MCNRDIGYGRRFLFLGFEFDNAMLAIDMNKHRDTACLHLIRNTR